MLEILTNQYQVFSHLIDRDKYIELDLGCGKGSFTIQLAQRYPDRQVFGADIMLGRVRKIKNRSNDHFGGVPNITLLRASAQHLIGYQLPAHSIDRIHVLCPDPWPKARHRPKRLLCSEFFGHLANVIKIGGTLHLATDDMPYLEFIKEAMKGNQFFELDMSLIDDIKDIKTDFERKWAAEGKDTVHLAFKRKSGV